VNTRLQDFLLETLRITQYIIFGHARLLEFMCIGIARRLWMAPLSRGMLSVGGVRAYSSVFHPPQQAFSTSLKCRSPSLARILSATPGFHLHAACTQTPTANNSSALFLLKYVSRNHSVLSRPSFTAHSLGTLGLNTRTEVRQFHGSGFVRYDRLQNLEDAANRDRDNANAQAVLMQVTIPSARP
jgi:hypothetical protein